MDLFGKPRLGIVVPPENPTAEPEFHHLLGASANVYTTRFPTTPGVTLRRMLETYNEVLPETLRGFGAMRLDASVVACSASHYLLGPDGDREFCAELSAQAGFPVTSATQAVLAACHALGVHRLVLLSPYQPWLTETSRAFWEEAGLAVDAVVSVPSRPARVADHEYGPYTVRTEDILRSVRASDIATSSTVLMTGTGMGTLAALDELARSAPARTFLTTNLASAWWAHATIGGDGGAHQQVQRLLSPAG